MRKYLALRETWVEPGEIYTLQKAVQIVNPSGFHMRPKAAFAEAAAKYLAEVRVIWNGAIFNGKSMLELMAVAAPEGSEIIIEVQGPDAQDAIFHLEKILQQVEAA